MVVGMGVVRVVVAGLVVVSGMVIPLSIITAPLYPQ
jgi:hypothetical protein